METYKIMWIPSTSDFVESRDVLGRIDSGAEFVVAGGLASSANEVTYDFPTGSLVEVWTRVYGDNNTQADSNHASFNASNQEGVKADTGLSVLWVGHKS